MKILHIAVHLGGGVGKAISGMAILGVQNLGDEHRILLLQAPEKDGHVQRCRKHGIPVSIWNGDTALLEWAEVIAVSWWDHPAMAQFIRNFPPCAAKLILWCHVNGCHYPCLTFPFTEVFDQVMFTSPYSLDNPAWTAAERERTAARSSVVYGMGDFHPEEIAPQKPRRISDQFTIGYAGTLNYGKIHPQFPAFCKAVCDRISTARFVMLGDFDANLEQDIRAAGLRDKFAFKGFVPDALDQMRMFDVFGYLLNPEHYGTTENVLLEAMACGVPPVVLQQNVEQYIVPPDDKFLVTSPEEYGERIEYLWKHPAAAEEMGRCAREHVLRVYDAMENAARFRNTCLHAMHLPTRLHDFSILGDSPWLWFSFCLDRANQERFQEALELVRSGSKRDREKAVQLVRCCPPILKEARKSSLRHFAAEYPGDETLKLLSSMLDE